MASTVVYRYPINCAAAHSMRVTLNAMGRMGTAGYRTEFWVSGGDGTLSTEVECMYWQLRFHRLAPQRHPKATSLSLSWSTANIMLRGFKQGSQLNLRNPTEPLSNLFLFPFLCLRFFPSFQGFWVSLLHFPAKCITFPSSSAGGSCSDLGIISK